MTPRKILTVPLSSYGLALATSLLFFLAFPPVAAWPLAFVALIPLLLALRQASLKRAFFISWLSFSLFFVLLLHWIIFNPAVEVWVRPLLYLGLLLGGAYLGLFWAVAVAVARWVGSRSRIPVWLCLIPLFTCMEWLRSQGLLGFPWGNPGYAFVRWTRAIQMAEFTGIYGLTCWALLVNGLVLWTIDGFREPVREPGTFSPVHRRILRPIALVLAVAIPPLWGSVLLARTGDSMRQAPEIRVALIQGNIDQGLRWDREFKDYNWATYRDLSHRAAASKPDLIVWPETAMPFYLRYEPGYFGSMLALSDELGTAIITGVPDVQYQPRDEQQLYYNAAFMFMPRVGLCGTYAKSHLVPFGERFPLKEHIPFLREVSFGEGEWTPGVDTVLFRRDTVALACLICFESIFPEIARRQAGHGARLFVNITNDGWFGRSGAARQHAEMAVLRAVEERRAITRCANSGISMFILPTGEMLQATKLFTRDIVVQSLPLLTKRTWYQKNGDLFLLLLTVVSFAGIIPSLIRRKK